ncbi:hypothetical protein AX15_007684 [Amanita polypyramis BW_CC]|nr:hypothetical protein AX15_007684 [Amanita polypyramis BW_CC]
MGDERISYDSIAEAAARRLQEQTLQASPAQLIKEQERRLEFRRLIDPKIIRPNSRDQAMASLNTLLRIAENLIREPDNQRFKRFRATNPHIKRDLVDPKGTLEYAIGMGFRPQVHEFDQYYVHDPRYMNDLQMGYTILKDFLDLENDKAERANRAKKENKLVAEGAALKVRMAFMDDRINKAMRDQREREQRTARIAGAQSAATSSVSGSPPRGEDIPGIGHTLRGDPPPYSDDGNPQI